MDWKPIILHLFTSVELNLKLPRSFKANTYFNIQKKYSACALKHPSVYIKTMEAKLRSRSFYSNIQMSLVVQKLHRLEFRVGATELEETKQCSENILRLTTSQHCYVINVQ